MFMVQKENIELECKGKKNMKSGANVWSKYLGKKRGKKLILGFCIGLKLLGPNNFIFLLKKLEKGSSQSPKF